MNSVVIGVGSNINPEYNVSMAEKEVSSLGDFMQKSDFVYTKPLLFEAQNDFLNGAFYFQTQYGILELEKKLKEIERKLGRKREDNKNGPRTIDLDIVIYNNQVVEYDVFKRDFLKNIIVGLFPWFSDILNCKNYMNYFDDVNKIIETIKSVLLENPISIFGAGHWFSDKEYNESDIEIIVIVSKIDDAYESLIAKKLEMLYLDKIRGRPVKVSLFWLKELREKVDGKSLAVNKNELQKIFITQFPFHMLLYGKHWSFSVFN